MAGLRIIGVTSKGELREFEQIVHFSCQSDRFTPADSFRCTVLDRLVNCRIMKLAAQLDGRRIFEGIVDVQQTILDQAGRRTEFVCRSNAALMLDNEVRPGVYERYSANQLIKEHAMPFGARGHHLPRNVTLPRILAHKGSSHWEFICLFCRLAYGKTPFLDGEGKLVLTPLSDKLFTFSNSWEHAIAFSSATLCEDRYNMISALHVQTKSGGGNVIYGHRIDNKIANTLGVVRERYYSPSQEWEGNASLSGAAVMREKQLDYQELTVEVPGFLDAAVGDRAELSDDDGEYGALYVAQVYLSGTEKGETTRLKLWDRRALEG